MDKLPSNRDIQRPYVAQYIKEWAYKIDIENHPMSGILDHDVDGSVLAEANMFLPSHLHVQICHGQHRKLVMEERINQALLIEQSCEGIDLPDNHKFPLSEIYAHPQAYWIMNVSQHCKILLLLLLLSQFLLAKSVLILQLSWNKDKGCSLHGFWVITQTLSRLLSSGLMLPMPTTLSCTCQLQGLQC